ncbi:aminomethyl-transferring glycine dehydrogenase subunit GcvPA [Trichothermofontia sp.]
MNRAKFVKISKVSWQWSDDRVARYSSHTPTTRQYLLQTLDLADMEPLLAVIPADLRQPKFNLPPGKSELEVRQLLQQLAAANHHLDQLTCFLGAGCYRHFIPAAVWAIVGRGEFLTSYTPYQPEAAQGTLQTIFEFQTGIARLTGLPIANASLYDGASATAEAVLMALRQQKNRSHLLLAESLHPEYRELLTTYLQGLDVTQAIVPTAPTGQIDLTTLQQHLQQSADACAAVVVQSPNFYGGVEEVAAIANAAHAIGALLIVVVTDPTTLAVLQPPGQLGADIVAGEGHALGTPPSYGGPHLGLLAARQEFLRQIPGRLVSLAQDARGQTAYTLTLQTREQHIRRAKATSNVCTNQSLMAAAAAVYMALLGPDGLRQMATVSLQRAHGLAEQIQALPGYALVYSGPFFHEFVVRCPIAAQTVIDRALTAGLCPGVALSRWFPDRPQDLLVCVTEMNSMAEVARLVGFLRDLVVGEI